MFLGSIFQGEITPRKVPVRQEKRGISLPDFKWSEFTYRSPVTWLPGLHHPGSQGPSREAGTTCRTFHPEHFTSSRLLPVILALRFIPSSHSHQLCLWRQALIWMEHWQERKERGDGTDKTGQFMPNATKEDLTDRVHLTPVDQSLLPYGDFPGFITSSHILGQNKTQCISKWTIVENNIFNYNALKLLK